MRSTETERMLRLRDVARLPAEVLVKRFEEDFGNLVTAAVADATRRLPAPVRRLLDGLEWHLDWADALVWAEGELQVSAERMTLLGDPRLRRVEGQLRQVRVRLHEARCVAADYRRQDRERLEQGRLLTARATALSWLGKALPEEYAALFAARVAELGIPPLRRHTASRDVFDSIEQAVAQGRLWVTAGPEVTALLELPDDTFRAAVADDVREQNARNVLLRHPLVLRRWHAGLARLCELTVGPARASSATALGRLPVDLAGLPRQEAMQIINARRFFCAVQQRRLDCDRTVRGLMAEIVRRERADPVNAARREAGVHARLRLAEAHPEAYARIREELRAYESEPGHLDPARLTSDVRGALKARLLAELGTGGGDPAPGAPAQPSPAPRPAPRPKPGAPENRPGRDRPGLGQGRGPRPVPGPPARTATGHPSLRKAACRRAEPSR
ncbi:hypothetical protein CLM83_07335 [Streptomyces albidoflavus]|uniref:hypothetical protein n=1 Tax=Streptomyces albidoflavus TaxID=1886 RepID=UPI000BAE4922|nr:hypothetical protein [Streptomyces albidoflavus]PAX87445.1 hypothetical protein CLM81_06175 [Streptomyces albidoflavus]PAX91720.1 hypothetical protein CLM82_07790 [Streptomyces albidoflavus]PBO19314.1 hypothetical protein CLM83_07335 [Streptomyces albidoflavus]PBO28835.1 hypothetical protein CLM84_17655 [Streptomyces albidoflavus]